MKKKLLIVVLLTTSICFSQNSITENKKTENLIRVWGLLKYKHPNVSRGNFDMDKQFIQEFNKLKSINTQTELNSALSLWIQGFKSTKYGIKINRNTSTKLFTKNVDYSWITTSNFSPELIEHLDQIKNNSNYKNHYASINKMSHSVQFKNDMEYIGFDADKKSNRLLFLASFWNKMRYWNVNIYLTETPWNTVLSEMIPDFLSKNKKTYDIAKDKLFAKLNDSHSNYISSTLFKNPKLKFSLYIGRIMNDSLVIRALLNKKLAKKEDIELGDVIYSINGKTTSTFYKEKFSNRISASNNNYLKSTIQKFFLLSNISDSIKIGLLKKDGKKKETYIKLYKRKDYAYNPAVLYDTLKSVKWNKIKKDIGYINLAKINKSELKNAFKAFKKTKGIVIDLRNYPRNLRSNDLPSFLYPKKKVFMKILVPHAPSIGKYNAQSALKIIKNPFAAGRNNKNYYKGKVVLLVDRTTASMAEYFALAIQASPNCITIGEQTFGAVMNRNQVLLKDKTTVDFTGNGAFYPDNISVQRQGLKIDYLIQERATEYDVYQYINEAVKIIQKK